MQPMFWSSVVLTGDQTDRVLGDTAKGFWSSVVLTGDQTSGLVATYSDEVLEQCRSDW